jgi:Inositol phospholipid synthesis and fat-storage-inducing TM
MSPLLPTPLEAALLAIYPVTLFLGSLFSYYSPYIRASESVYSPAHQSFQPPSAAPSYFAQKRNVFNLYFVKIGWFWTTAALLLFLATHPSVGAPLSLRPTKRRAHAAARWALATLIWAATTQWFFGPALIDRSFRLTGGACEMLAAEQAGTVPEMGLVREIVTHAQCKIQGGTWSGGIDISGHVFLLILGSALLWLEMLPAVLKAQGLREARRIRTSDGRVISAAGEGGPPAEKHNDEREFTKLGVKVAVGVVGLSWWMLLMTAAFFHTWSEKLSGLIVALFGVWLVYFLPRGLPVLRTVLSMPGL